MSALDEFVPGYHEDADLPAALRKFAQWIETQKTEMAEQVRAEVAKIDQETIIANTLARIPETVTPFKVDIIRNTQPVGDTHNFTIPIPQDAKVVKITLRGGSTFNGDTRTGAGRYRVPPAQTIWFNPHSGPDQHELVGILGATMDNHNGVSSRIIALPSHYYEQIILEAAGAPLELDLPEVEVNYPKLAAFYTAMAMFEWYKTRPEGTGFQDIVS